MPNSLRSSLLSLLPALLLLAAPTGVASQDWPEFRGPKGQGVADATNPPMSWDKEKGVAWKAPIEGSAWSSPVLYDGKVVVTTGRTGQDGRYAMSVLQLDAASGKSVWEKDLFFPEAELAETHHEKNSLASGTPLVKEGVIYAHFAHLGTAALDFSTGKTLWKQQIAYAPVHGSGGSPVWVNGLLVFNTDGKEDPAVVALDAKTGKLAWRTPRDQEVKNKFSFCTPLVIRNNGRLEIVSPGSGMVGAYAPEDGRLLWKVSYGNGYSVVPRPVFGDNRLYVATGFGRPNLFAIRTDGATGDLTETHIEWQTDRRMPKTPSPVLSDGCLYVLDDIGGLSCLDANTGELKWEERVKGSFSSSPTLVGNVMYCFAEDGRCYVLEVSPKGGKIVWETDFEERILASPAIADGALYIRSESHLWKIQN